MNEPFEDRLARAQEALDQADAVLIGAGAGLSAAAGLQYGGERFRRHFADFIAQYGLKDMYSSMFFKFPTREHRWAYVSRHILINRFEPIDGKAYEHLLALTADRTRFVLTTNADALFFRTGFRSERVFAMQGDYGLFQCRTPCHETLYDNETTIREMVAAMRDFQVPTTLLPVCPRCGDDLVPHLRIDNTFVENSDWQAAARRYQDFLETTKGRRIVLLELGVGYNTPGIIKYPFERFVAAHDQATLLRFNRDHPEVSDLNRDRTIMFAGDLEQQLAALAQ